MTLVPRIVEGLRENGADDVLVVIWGDDPAGQRGGRWLRRAPNRIEVLARARTRGSSGLGPRRRRKAVNIGHDLERGSSTAVAVRLARGVQVDVGDRLSVWKQHAPGQRRGAQAALRCRGVRPEAAGEIVEFLRGEGAVAVLAAYRLCTRIPECPRER